MQQYYKDLACNFVAKCIISLYPCVFCFNLILNNFLNHKRWNLVSVLKVSQWDFQNLNMWCFNKKYLRNIFPEAIEDEVILWNKGCYGRQTNLDIWKNEKGRGFEEGKENYFHIFDEAEGQKLQKKPSLYMVSYWPDDQMFCSRRRLTVS